MWRGCSQGEQERGGKGDRGHGDMCAAHRGRERTGLGGGGAGVLTSLLLLISHL